MLFDFPAIAMPLAARMRPRTLDEFVGQQELLGPGRALRAAIERDAVPSMILWGPPGSGKTTLAEIIAGQTGAHFERMSAVSAGVGDLRRVLNEARVRRRTGKPTILFIDEIHRFNKAQQDVVLPFVEDGTVTLIGATTENPSFEVNSALLSRARVFVLDALSDEEVGTIVDRALRDAERGLGAQELRIDEEARALLVGLANGDARAALSSLELAAASARGEPPLVDVDVVREAMQRRNARYDKGGEMHYDTISALIKSVRASDADASLYWLARLIEGGEDPLFIARRLVILASEDVGLADSTALQVAVAAQQAVHFVGMPEGFFPLAHATLYLATAPKSNSVGASYGAAMADVLQTRNDPVPLHLRNAPTRLMRQLGYGEGYHYSHDDYEVEQLNLPPGLADRRYYVARKQGAERVIAERQADKRRRPE
ncbi:MAG TPA: replication-associated recombination protein A [Candidatus Cybelea sp.]|nr:replication-associated recombination protein A [Candidatus Cybelea sp.]